MSWKVNALNYDGSRMLTSSTVSDIEKTLAFDIRRTDSKIFIPHSQFSIP
jgi:hypothetical protein